MEAPSNVTTENHGGQSELLLVYANVIYSTEWMLNVIITKIIKYDSSWKRQLLSTGVYTSSSGLLT